MPTESQIKAHANRILPKQIPDFISKTEALLEEMRDVVKDTPEADQPMAAAKIFAKYGAI